MHKLNSSTNFGNAQKFIKKLPQKRIEARSGCIDEAIGYITSNEFSKKKIDGVFL